MSKMGSNYLASWSVSVFFHALRVAKHVPRLRARCAAPAAGKTRLLCPGLSWELIPLSVRSSHAADVPLRFLAAAVVPALH